MRRSQIQIDERMYELLREEAHARHTSISALVRVVLQKHLGLKPQKQCMKDFTFVGSGRSKDIGLAPLSERHDEALAEDFE